MATKSKRKPEPSPTTETADSVEAAAPQALPTPANRLYVFAKNCTNDHGKFVRGDKARGSFSPDLVHSYLAAGILVPAQGE